MFAVVRYKRDNCRPMRPIARREVTWSIDTSVDEVAITIWTLKS